MNSFHQHFSWMQIWRLQINFNSTSHHFSHNIWHLLGFIVSLRLVCDLLFLSFFPFFFFGVSKSKVVGMTLSVWFFNGFEIGFFFLIYDTPCVWTLPLSITLCNIMNCECNIKPLNEGKWITCIIMTFPCQEKFSFPKSNYLCY